MKNKTLFSIRKLSLFFTGLIIIVSIISCRKEIPQIYEPNKYGVNNYTEVFESFWTGMNNNYVFWDIDATNWDEVYTKYKPLFAKLDINNTADQKIANKYLEEMTANLADGHYRITVAANYGGNIISPSGSRIRNSVNFHERLPNDYFSNTMANKYLDKGFSVFNGDVFNDDDVVVSPNFIMLTGTIKKDIFYLHFSDFILSQILNENFRDDISDELNSILENYINEVTTNKNLKGLVIDLRSNNGGTLVDVNILVGILTKTAFKIGSTHYKNGLNRLNYTPWLNAHVYPNEGSTNFNKPIVVIADRYSGSMGELSTMALRLIPSSPATFVGERTYGAQGPLTPEIDVYNGGQFTTTYFTKVLTSSSAFRYIDGKSYEGVGFPPDIEVKYNKAAFSAGIDLQLEKAISVIEGKK